MKTRIAILLHGGIGTGHFSQGYPLLHKIVGDLSKDYDIDVYSHSTPNAGFRAEHFSLVSPRAELKSGLRRWLSVLWTFTKNHRKGRYQLVIAFWGYPAGVFVVLLGKVFNVPSAVYLLGADSAGVPDINYGVLHKPMLRRVLKWAYSQTVLLLCISQYQVEELKKYGISARTKVIPWGVVLADYPFCLKVAGERLKVIHVGHLTAVKDQVTLIRTFAEIIKIQPAVLRIFGGDAGMKESIVRLINELQLKELVEFFDVIPYDEMPAQYEWADVMIHTSLSEGQSMAVTEAAASGVLIAGTKVGLLFDLDDSAAIRVSVRDYKSLSKLILQVYADPSEWSKKVREARRWTEVHDFEWTMAEIKKSLTTIILPAQENNR